MLPLDPLSKSFQSIISRYFHIILAADGLRKVTKRAYEICFQHVFHFHLEWGVPHDCRILCLAIESLVSS